MMLGSDPLQIIFKSIVLIVFAPAFILSLIFTFNVEIYHILDGLLSYDFLHHRKKSPLEKGVHVFDDWLIERHKLVGPVLCLLCLLNIFALFRLIDLIGFLRQ